jgi:glycosyltransferase involved in cell wall biosynthesis
MGGKIYLENLLRALRLVPQSEIQPVLICGEANAQENADLAMLTDDVLLLKAPTYPGFKLAGIFAQNILRMDLQDLHAQQQLKRAGVHVLFPFNALQRYRSLHRIAWIPDLQHRYFPHFFTDAEIAGREKEFNALSRRTGLIVVSSQATAKDMETFYPEARGKLRVMPFATIPVESWFEDDVEQVQARYALPPRYFLVCNQFWKHKNHRIVMEALAISRKRGCDVRVVCTGSTRDLREAKSAYFDSLTDYLRAEQIEDAVHFLGLVPRVDQMKLMRGAIAVVQPSLFEGWSTVLEDARVFQKKVLASHLPVHREQALDGAEYFDPQDATALAGLMEKTWLFAGSAPSKEAEELREACLERGRLFARRFFEIVAEATAEK